MRGYGSPQAIVTDKPRSYGAAMRDLGNTEKQQAGRWLNNRIENSQLSFRRRERASLRFQRMRWLQKFAAVHSSIHNHFNQERHHCSRGIYKASYAATLTAALGLCVTAVAGDPCFKCSNTVFSLRGLGCHGRKQHLDRDKSRIQGRHQLRPRHW